MKHSLIFAGSSAFSAGLLSYLASCEELSLKLVITLPPKKTGRGKKIQENPVQKVAQELGLPVKLTGSLKNKEDHDSLSSLESDYLVVAAFGLMIPQWLLSLPKKLPLNIHASLLPRWRGASPIHHALWHQDEKTGICLMKMTKGLDEGPVLIEKEVLITQEDLFESLEKKLLELSKHILSLYFQSPDDFSLIPQEGTPVYAPKIEKKDGLLTKQMDVEKVIATFKAFHLWPGLSFIEKNSGENIKILRIENNPVNATGTPGTISVENDHLLLNLENKALKVFQIQFPGKNPLMIKDCAHDKQHKIYQLSF